MIRFAALAIVLALGAGTAHAKTARCTDPTTHKFVKCTAATAPAATPAAPAAAKKPSLLSGLMKPRAPTPAQSTPPAPQSSSSSMSTAGAPLCNKGKVCGHSCIAMTKVCHKPG